MIIEVEGINLAEQQPAPEFIDDIAAWYEQNKGREVRLIGAVEKYAYKANEDGSLSISQDNINHIFYRKGQMIVTNPGEDPYPFGNQDEEPAASTQRFHEDHTKLPNGKYIRKPFKAIPVTEDIEFLASNGVKMTVKKGGYVAEGLYGIADESAQNYRVMDED